MGEPRPELDEAWHEMLEGNLHLTNFTVIIG
jgi:hypothetical protein